MVIEDNGYLVDDETGEVVGHSALTTLRSANQGIFCVHDTASAEWVLEKMQGVEAEIKALELQRDAVVENLNRMIKAKETRKNWWNYRFGRELEEFARQKIQGMKSKFVDTAYGRLSFRKNPSSLSIRPEMKEKAIQFVKENHPYAIQTKVTENVLVSELKGQEDHLPDTLFEYTPGYEKFRIETGVGA